MILRAIVVVLVLAAGAGWCLAAEPVVSNVEMVQRPDGSGLVDITYDLADADGDTVAIALRLSVDGGSTWDYPTLNLSGDIGTGVVPGTGRRIVWNAEPIPDLPVLSDLRARVIANDVGVALVHHSPGVVSITDFSQIDWTDPEAFDLYARAEIIQLMGSVLWQGGAAADIPVITELKQRNPALKVIAYVSVKSAQLSAQSPTADQFWQQWYLRTQPYQVLTTAGEPASDFPGNVLINILEPDCRRVMVETIKEFQDNSLNKFDGVYWDYFNASIWVHPDVQVSGDPDFDGDGIGHQADPDERVAFRAAQVSLIQALRDSMGTDFIQFFNGQRAYSDTTFAALGDGALYELFPTLFFPDPDMKYALDPAYPYSLLHASRWFRTDNGGPYLVLANTWQNWYTDHNGIPTQIINGNVFRAVAMITDTYASWNTSDLNPYSNSYGWTDNDISIGQPLGPPVYEGNFIRRDFQYGRVEIEMKTGRYPNPFNYRIWALGQLVEELRIPYHFP